MTNTRKLLRPLILTVVVVLLQTGCQTYKNQVRGTTALWTSGQVSNAAVAFAKQAVAKDKSKDAIIWHLEAGAALRAAGEFEASNEHLDAAAIKMDEFEMKAKIRIGQEVEVALSNQQNAQYEGRSYDKIMAHTYRALNDLSVGDIEAARTEIIRAYQCQQDAVEDNKRRIEQAQTKEQQCKDRDRIQAAKGDPRLSQTLTEIAKSSEGFSFYADYVNPFTVYLDGLYFLHAGAGGSDLERARKSLSRVREVVGNSAFIDADLQLVEGSGGGQQVVPLTYVIFETGRAASLDEVRIDIPLVFTRVSYVGAALPKLAFHNDHADRLTVTADGKQEQAALLANMDAIVALDFKNEWPVVLTKTMVSTITKAVAAYIANEAVETAAKKRGGNKNDQMAAQMLSLFTKVATAAYQASVNIADTRSWTTLPKEFQVARIVTPADRKLSLTAPGLVPTEIELMDGSVNVVYVKSIAALAAPTINQFKLK